MLENVQLPFYVNSRNKTNKWNYFNSSLLTVWKIYNVFNLELEIAQYGLSFYEFQHLSKMFVD